jgi:uncharacterized phage-associated protein
VELDREFNRQESTARTGMASEVIDVRAIANEVLRRAGELDIEVTNMAINKIVYFVHCDFMLEAGDPLVGAKIEAWQHGPVFRELYYEFKIWEDRPIKAMAKRVSPETGEFEEADFNTSVEQKDAIHSIIDRYIGFSAAQLRALSHARGGPWDQVWQHSGNANPGMQISNDLIKQSHQRETKQ